MSFPITVPMATLCSIKSGKSDTKDAVENGEFAFFDRSKVIKKSSRYLYDCEALIVAGEGAEFLPKHFIGKFDLHQRAYAIHNFNEKINVKYLFYYLHYLKDYLPSVAVGATVKSLRLRHFENLPVVLFSIATQNKIVEKLDAIFAQIDRATVATQANFKNSEALFLSYLTEVFERDCDEWNSDELGNLTKFIDYRGKTPTKTDSGVRLITAKNVKFGYLNKEPYEYIAEADYESWMTRGIPVKGDVLFTTEAPLANVAQLDTDEKVVFAQRLIILQSKHGILDNEFLKFSLLSKKIQDVIISKGTGATVKGIKASLLKKIHISYPSIERQKEICKSVSTIKFERDKLKDFYAKRIRDFNSYKQSILKQAFSGELIKE